MSVDQDSVNAAVKIYRYLLQTGEWIMAGKLEAETPQSGENLSD